MERQSPYSPDNIYKSPCNFLTTLLSPGGGTSASGNLTVPAGCGVVGNKRASKSNMSKRFDSVNQMSDLFYFGHIFMNPL